MDKKINIAIIYNDPEPEFIIDNQNLSSIDKFSKQNNSVDLSEVGVYEERVLMEKFLLNAGYKTLLFNINNNVNKLVDFLANNKIDLIFNLCETLKGMSLNEMHVAGIYELFSVPYTGSSTITLGTCLNKVRTKILLNAYKIKTPNHIVYKTENEVLENKVNINYPIIVKPLKEDASIGIENSSVVKNFVELKNQVIQVLIKYKQPAIAEEYIEGRELNVAILGNANPIALPISEIDFSGLPPEYPKIVTYNAKWLEGSAEYSGTVGKCPAILPETVEKEIINAAINAYKIMEARDYARVDIRLSKDNIPYVLEVNPNPDISPDSGFARSAKHFGLDYEKMIVKIIEVALERIN